MKKTLSLGLTSILVAMTFLTLTVGADFAKTKTYSEGLFTDIPQSAWYAESVKDAYEFGIMNGNSVSTFNPEGTLTVAEGITIASRINEVLTGVAIPESAEGQWYQRYVNYAVANGIMSEDQFDSYSANIKRYEIAELLAKAAKDLTNINNVTKLPDVASGADYAEAVLKLYNAGILGGNDAYGTFAPNSYLLRSEISAMSVRIADSTKRVKKDFAPIEARAYTDSYYIIESITGSNNGWGYDNRFEFTNTIGGTSGVLMDTSDEQFFANYRDFDPESEGILRLEHVGEYSTETNKGIYIALQNGSEENILEFTPVDGVWTINGINSVKTAVAISTTPEEYAFVVEIDLDKNIASATINNIYCGTVEISPKAILQRLALGTSKEGKGRIQKIYTRMSKNYPVDENFIITDSELGKTPALWNVTGDFVIDRIDGTWGVENYNLKANSKEGTVSTASKSFEPISGKLVFECNVFLPEKTDGTSVALTSNGTDVFKFETKNGNFVMGDTVLHDYITGVWQWLYVEADTYTGKAKIKINGKERAVLDFDVRTFDGINTTFAPSKDAVVYFDDFEVYPLIDHADYPSYPVVSESTDYNIGVNACYLWRDLQSSEGWDAVSPFAEFDSYLGFYDDGLRETADWELKWMAEHGIDFINICWYCPGAGIPIKKMNMSHSALHDGYMNAKYSNLVKFCIMWENSGNDAKNFEQFKEYIWPYWKEYYFSDDRYMRLDNKAVLTVWDTGKFLNTFGGTTEGAKEAVNFMNNELKAMGYDGILLLATIQVPKSESYYKSISDMGFDGSYGYHWGSTGSSADYQISCNEKNSEYSAEISNHIPTIAMGFNDIGRNDKRSDIITENDHLKVAQNAKELLNLRNTGTWKDNTIIVSTWNEWSEGHYVMPTDELGFTYLENIRKVFTDDISDHTYLDVKPTKTQIDRVGHLYAPNHSPLRRLKFEKSDAESAGNTDSYVAVHSYDMAGNGVDAWDNFFGIKNYSEKDGTISGESTSNDFALKTSQGFMPFNASSAPILHIRMKTSDIKNGEIYFVTDSDPNWSDSKRVFLVHTQKDEFVDYYINMGSNIGWKGTVTALRIDPLTLPGSFEISLIEFMNLADNKAGVPKISVNGTELSFSFNPIVLSDGDYAVVGEARNGFYSMLRLYYEWDRFTQDGVLTLKSFDEHTYVLRVNSDKVLVDGVEKSLGFTFTLRDGLPVFHIKKFLDILGYNYTLYDADMEITAASEKESQELDSKVENWWEFNDAAAATEGFTAQQGVLSLTNDGYLAFTAGNGTDVAVLRKIDLDASKYEKIVIGMEYNELLLSETSQLFFTTSTNTGLSADKVIYGKADMNGKKPGDTVEITFNLSNNHMFAGNVNLIRFDPYSGNKDFKIDYVRCIKKGYNYKSENSVALTERKINLATNLAGLGAEIISCEESKLEAISLSTDPNFTIKGVGFDTSEVSKIHIRMSSTTATVMQIYFATDSDGALSETKSARANVMVSDDMVDYYIDVSANPLWKGRIVSLRFDPVMTKDTRFVIGMIELVK